MAKTIKRSAESFSYTLLADRALPPEQQTQFVLRPLTMSEYAAAHDDLVRTYVDAAGGRMILSRSRQNGIELVLEHLIAVHNFPVGAPRAWPSTIDERLSYLDMMAYDDLKEIAQELYRRSEVGDEEKNSSTPERTSGSGANSPAPTSTTAPPAANAG